MRPFSLAVCLALVVSLASALGLPTAPGIAARPAAAGVSCVAPGGNLATNGSFESPDISPDGSRSATPDGWTGGDTIYHNGTSPDGNQHVALFTSGSIEQSIPTTGLAGTTLTVTYLYRGGSTVTLGTTSITQPSVGFGTYATGTATYQVPAVSPPATVLLRFGGNDLDRVSVTAACPDTNRPPVIAGGVTTLSYTVNERRSGQTGITVPLSLDLSDPDGDSLTLETTTPESQHGRFVGVLFGENGGPYSTSYTPVNGYVGPDQYGVLVSDGNGGTLTLLINVTVQNTNDQPRATGETLASSPEDTVRMIPFANLLANDSPGANDAAAGDFLIVSGVSNPVGGTAAIVGQTVEFTPTAGYNGPASFRYTVQDRVFGTAQATASFTIDAVNDPPVIDEATVPEDQTLEATGPDGVAFTFTPPTATDVDTGDTVTVTCDPASGTTFPIATTIVTCTAADEGGLTDTANFDVLVQDTSAPIIDLTTVPGTPTLVGSQTVRVLSVEATGPQTTVAWSTVFADDIVDGRLPVGCRVDADGDATSQPDGDPIGPGGTTFPIGDTLVNCIVLDDAGNSATTSFIVRVEDTMAPAVTVPANISIEATGPTGTTVTYTATATDLVDGAVTPVCAPVSGSLFPIGTTTVSCTATDSRGNASATKTFTVTVGDSTGPVITWVGGPQPNRTYTQATLPTEPTCTATDAASEVTQCRVYGYSTAPGTHTLTARARDDEGNSSVSTRTYTVTASAPTATPRPPTATPRPTSVPPTPTATPTRPARPTTAPAQPTATTAPVQPTATPVTPVVQPTGTPTRPPRR